MRVCKECGESFTQRDYRSLYCSRACANARNIKRVITKCATCGEDIEHIPSKPQKYCGRECERIGKGWEKKMPKYSPMKYPSIRRVIATASSELVKGNVEYQELHQSLCRLHRRF